MSAYELFLKAHAISKGDNKISTHTRIGDKNAKIYGGNYHIPDEKYEEFMKLYLYFDRGTTRKWCVSNRY